MVNQEQLISQEHQKNLIKIYHSKLKDKECSICKNKFTEREVLERNDFVSGISVTCGKDSKYEEKFYHHSCQVEIQKEKTKIPLLFAKVEQLERELAELKNGKRAAGNNH